MNREGNRTLLSRDHSSALHGAAILMMIYHHLFITGNTWYKDYPVSLFDVLDPLSLGKADTFQLTFAWFCKICVAVFAFTSGYAMYVQFSKRCNEGYDLKVMYGYCLKRLWSFYKKYLFCFLFFVTIDYFSGNQNGFDYSLTNYVLNLLGIRATYNSTWWYILIYYYMILLSPLVYVLLKKLRIKGYLTAAAIFVLTMAVALFTGHLTDYLKSISHFIQNYIIIYLIIFMEGMFCGRYPIADHVASKLNAFSSLLLLLVTFVARALLIRAPSDSLFDLALTIFFVIGFTRLISYSEKCVHILGYLGHYSSYMWYAHAYFYSYLFFDLVLRADLSLLVFLQVTVYSLAVSILFDRVEKALGSGWKRMLKKDF